MLATNKFLSHLLILMSEIFYSSVASQTRKSENANNKDTTGETTSGNDPIRMKGRSGPVDDRNSGKYVDCTKAVLNKATKEAEVQFEYLYYPGYFLYPR